MHLGAILTQTTTVSKEEFWGGEGTQVFWIPFFDPMDMFTGPLSCR